MINKQFVLTPNLEYALFRLINQYLKFLLILKILKIMCTF